MSETKSRIRIGTRGSQLALYQAELVRDLILQSECRTQVEIIKIRTSGDAARSTDPDAALTKRIFTKEIEDALLNKEVDVAVHSAKDMAVPMPEGLMAGAVLEREDARDCLVHAAQKKLADLPLGARIGTSSLRRKMQLLRLYPHLRVEEVHGNVETRIRKMEEGQFDAVVLAYAGLKRLGLADKASEIFPELLFYPAPGQGVIVAQCREKDEPVRHLLRKLNHEDSQIRLLCERAFLKTLEGGCRLPCGITTKIEAGKIYAKGILLAAEGPAAIESEGEGAPAEAESVGDQLARKILESGGRAILEQLKSGPRKGTA